jgi:hypothetical protein
VKKTLALLAIVLAGCASGPPRPVDPTNNPDWYIERQASGDSLYFLHYTTTVGGVMSQATAYCRQRGRAAVVQSQNVVGDMRMVTTFVCRAA